MRLSKKNYFLCKIFYNKGKHTNPSVRKGLKKINFITGYYETAVTGALEYIVNFLNGIIYFFGNVDKFIYGNFLILILSVIVILVVFKGLDLFLDN